MTRLLLGQHEGAIFPTGEAPQQGGRQHDGKYKVFGAEETDAVREQRINENLHSIAECHAGGGKEQEYRLPNSEPLLALYLQAADVKREDKKEHGDAEMVGNDG